LTALALAVPLLGFSEGRVRAATLHPHWAHANPSEPSGEILLHGLQCASCHAPEATVARPLAARKAPDLRDAGSRLSPQFLRAYLSNPDQTKPGTLMPDVLHGQPNTGERVDDLVHFLASLGDASAPESVGANPFKMEAGRRLYHQVGCVACHQAFAGPDGSGDPGPFAESSIPLGPLATKYTVPDLAAFLKDPLRYRPSGRMPSMNLTEAEAEAIAMYLLRDQAESDSRQPPQKIQGLFFEYFEAHVDQALKLEQQTPVSTGTVENFLLGPKRRNDNIGFRYTGYISVPRDGTHTFYIASDDGSRLYLGDRMLIDNDRIQGTTEKSGTVELQKGDHPIMVLWFNAAGGAELRVSYEGPGLKKQPVPNQSLSHLGRAMMTLNQEPLSPDPDKMVRGKAHFTTLGCASCHDAGVPSTARPVPSLLSLGKATTRGCLAEEPPAGVPEFNLSPSQRKALRDVLARPDTLLKAPTPAETVDRILTANNCLACHERGGQGGPEGKRTAYFEILTKDELGDEGRIPPHLNGVGAKLRTDWIEAVLLKRGAVRPYMATRMPQFAAANITSLAPALEKTDLDDHETAHAASLPAEVNFGRLMVGNKGLSCISCHTFSAYPSLGIQAMDLTQMAQRLRNDWFHRYLINPSSLRPGTRMPSFWPQGRSPREDVLEGDTERQIQAIWTYLSQAGDAGIPHGLIQGKIELSNASETLIYRAFINDSGTRGIGVAFPEQANLTFDANALRLALIWQGPFIDAAKHRTGRGAGFEGPLGYNVVDMPTGPSFAFLDKPDAPWPVLTGREAGHQMLGYRLDGERRPTFRYRVNSVRIDDSPVAVPGNLEASLQRTFTLISEQSPDGFWFRAWRGNRIEKTAPNAYLLEGKIQMTFDLPAGLQPFIRNTDGKTELLVPIRFPSGQASFVQNIIW